MLFKLKKWFMDKVNVKIEENSTIIFDCQSNELGCGIVFNDLKIIDNHILELSIKLKNSDRIKVLLY